MTRKLLTATTMAGLTVSMAAGAAFANPFFGNNKPTTETTQTTTTTQVTPAATSSPEYEAAATRVDQLNAKLQQAKKQLDAAKANLKAADSELRAARAAKEALGLRNEATELASKAAVDPIVGNGQTTNGLGVAQATAADTPTVHNLDGTPATSPVPGPATTTTTTTTTSAPPTLQDLVPNN
jgi:hypothetical protein